MFDLLKISRETPNVLSQSNLPIVNSFDEIVPFNFFDNDLQQRPSIAITDFDSIQPRPSTTLTDYDSVQPRPSTLPTNYKLQQRPTEVTPANEKLQQRPTEVTPANDNIAGNISEILAQSVTVNDPVEEQTYLDERTPLQKRVVAPANIIPTTSIYETYDIPDNVRQMPMNTTDGIIDITPHVQHFDVNQRDVSRISDLCEVAIPQHEEELIPTENNNRQRLLPNNNQLRNTSLQLMQPYKNIIHRGQKYIQFEDDLKFSVYFLKVSFIEIKWIKVVIKSDSIIFSSLNNFMKFNSFL